MVKPGWDLEVYNTIKDYSTRILLIWLALYIVVMIIVNWLTRVHSCEESDSATSDNIAENCKNNSRAITVASIIKYIFLTISAVCWLAAVLYVTLISRAVLLEAKYEFSLLWEYRKAFMVTENGVEVQSITWFYQIYNNIILFVPGGVILGGLLVKQRYRYIIALATGTVISSAVELAQLYMGRGMFETSDIMNNVVGFMAGFIVGCIIDKLLAHLE